MPPPPRRSWTVLVGQARPQGSRAKAPVPPNSIHEQAPSGMLRRIRQMVR